MPDNLIFDVQREPKKLVVRFSATMALIDNVAEEVNALMCGDVLEKHSFGVSVVMREGLTNAVRHGNKNNPEKLVWFTLFIKNDTLTMTIKDEGDGFDWEKTKKDCCCGGTSAVPLEHGRGVAIMKEYFDACDYNDKGNILTLKKDVSA